MLRLSRIARLAPLLLAACLAACVSSVVDTSAGPAPAGASAPLALVLEPGRGRGSESARFAIVEFGDYQCPYCRAFHVRTLPWLYADYVDTGKVRYFHVDFPLPHHAQALPAAVASHCAGAQGRYWEMQDRLYENQARLGDDLYAELAVELKLDPAQFAACRVSGRAQAAVQRDLTQARRLNVRVTPTFVLGRIEGERIRVERTVTGAAAYERFVREIDGLLGERR